MKLYKYTTAETCERILVNQALQFTPITLFNDVLECFIPKGHLAKVGFENRKKIGGEQVEYLKKTVYEANKHGANLDTSELLDQYLEGEMPELDPDSSAYIASIVFKEEFSNIGCLCMSSNPSNPLLWGHYAGSASGVCLEFSPATPIFPNHESHITLRQVQYCDDTPLNGSIGDSEFLRTIASTKRSEWSYESEWRYLRNLTSRNCPERIEFNKLTLTKIILGCNMNSTHARMIVQHAQSYLNAEIALLIPDLECPSLRISTSLDKSQILTLLSQNRPIYY